MQVSSARLSTRWCTSPHTILRPVGSARVDESLPGKELGYSSPGAGQVLGPSRCWITRAAVRAANAAAGSLQSCMTCMSLRQPSTCTTLGASSCSRVSVP